MPKILIADDNSNIQKMVALAFEDHKIEVVAVGNGEAAVKKLPDLKPDLILADVFMPVRNGYEVCEFVKRDARYSSIPVILLVGAFDPLDETEAKRVGADGVLKKPFVPPDPLISLVTELLNKHAKSVAKSAASKAAKEKEAAAETLPSLMPRRSQEPLHNSSGADDVYIVGKGREAIDDLNPQTATSSRQGAGSSNAYSNSNFTPQAVPAGNIPSDHSDSFNETNADARRRTEVDYQSVPSFSSALIGDSAAESAPELADDQGSPHKTVIQRLQERQEEEERRTVVPSPRAGAEPQQESQPAETNWAALVKSFTAAPFSISEPPPVTEQRQVEADPATSQSVSSQATVEPAQASNAATPESGVASSKSPFDDFAASSNANVSAAPSVAQTGQSIYEAGYQAASAASQPVSGAASSNASASNTEEVFTAPLRDESSSHHDHSSHSENSSRPENTSRNEFSVQAESPAHQETHAAAASPASAEANRPAFDEGLWSKIAMHATMPSEPPAPPKDLNSSDTAAQMIAAASEAAAAFSRGGFSLPGQSATPQSEAAQSDKSNSASASAQRLDAGKPNQQERSLFSFSPSDALNTEAAPTPRDVPHVFPSGAPDQNKDQTADQASPESAAAPSNDSIGVAADNAADANSSANTTASANVDEIVARVIERLAPQLQELISKGVLRPMVEDILRDSDAPKKN